MRYKILTSEIDATSMDKYTYLKDIEKVPIQHLENKRIKGFYCNWNGYTFWISENDFNKICIVKNMIKKYRKKPIEIDAIQYTGNNVSEIENFVGTNLLHYNTQEENDYQLGIPTLEGIMKASIGDYIIRGAKGEFYPCKPDIFKITYDEVQC